MKDLKKDLQSVVKELKSLTQKTEKISKKLRKLEKAKSPKKVKAKARVKAKAPVKKAKKGSATDAVLTLIRGSKKGIDTATLRKKTGYNNNKMRGIVFRLKQQRKIKRVGRGIYVKASKMIEDFGRQSEQLIHGR